MPTYGETRRFNKDIFIPEQWGESRNYPSFEDFQNFLSKVHGRLFRQRYNYDGSAGGWVECPDDLRDTPYIDEKSYLHKDVIVSGKETKITSSILKHVIVCDGAQLYDVKARNTNFFGHSLAILCNFSHCTLREKNICYAQTKDKVRLEWLGLQNCLVEEANLQEPPIHKGPVKFFCSNQKIVRNPFHALKTTQVFNIKDYLPTLERMGHSEFSRKMDLRLKKQADERLHNTRGLQLQTSRRPVLNLSEDILKPSSPFQENMIRIFDRIERINA